MDKEFYRLISETLASRQAAVLAIVISRQGSAPRETGAGMAIFSNGETLGTVGGGPLEARVMAVTPDVFFRQRDVCFKYSLNDSEDIEGGMICGGQVEILLHYLNDQHSLTSSLLAKVAAAGKERRAAWLVFSVCRDEILENVKTGIGLIMEDGNDRGSLDFTGAEFSALQEACLPDKTITLTANNILYLMQPLFPTGRVIIAGAGHIGQELAFLCHRLSFFALVIDDRPDFACRGRFPDASQILRAAPSFENCFTGLSITSSDKIVIVTRGHEHDRQVLGQALKTTAGYIGMIGSRRKREAIYESLRREGVTHQELARVCCPIGLSIGARTPAEIAVSIAAQLIAWPL